MDTQLAQKERLRKQIAALETKRSEMERGLAQVRGYLNAATSRRAELVSELAVADAATAAWAESEIDNLDRAISGHRRFIESHEAQLAKIAGDLAPLRSELKEVEQAIAAEARAGELKAFEVQLKQTRREAEKNLAAARLHLAELTTLAFRAVEQLGPAASVIADRELEEFVLQQANLENAGWREARPQFTPLRFFVKPMVRA